MTLPPLITTNDPDSFAGLTVSSRFPGIIRSILRNNALDARPRERLEGLLDAIPESSLELLPETSEVNRRMNAELKNNKYRWNNGPFIFIENYLYHLLGEILGFKNNGKDYFSFKKNEDVISGKEGLLNSIEKVDALIAQGYEDALRGFLYLNILGNKADLSQLSDLRGGKLKLLIDDTDKAAKIFRTAKRVDIVLDNSGEELFFDVLLAHFLFSKTMVEKVVLHFKAMPYFVSDAMQTDFHFLLNEISSDERGRRFADTINRYIKSGSLLLCDDPFWIDTEDFRGMNPELSGIDESDIMVFKGDLNYRKLVGDRHWDFTANTKDIAGYVKNNCLIIRVLKCELITGLSPETIPDLSQKTWMYNGEYGIIQTLTGVSG